MGGAMDDTAPVVSRRTFLEQLAFTVGGTLFVASCAPAPTASRGSSPAATVAHTPVLLGSTVEKVELTIGFIPITCSTPVIMAHPLGFYKRYGLDVTVKKFAGWADIRDAFIAKE